MLLKVYFYDIWYSKSLNIIIRYIYVQKNLYSIVISILPTTKILREPPVLCWYFLTKFKLPILVYAIQGPTVQVKHYNDTLTLSRWY